MKSVAFRKSLSHLPHLHLLLIFRDMFWLKRIWPHTDVRGKGVFNSLSDHWVFFAAPL